MSSQRSVEDHLRVVPTSCEPEMEPALVWLAVIFEKSKVGFAAYNEETNEIAVEESFVDSFQIEDTVERVLGLVRPNLLLLPKNVVANAALLETLTTSLTPSDDQVSSAREGVSIPFRIMKSATLEFHKARNRIVQQLRVSTLGNRKQTAHGANRSLGTFQISAYHSIKSLIDLESKTMVQAVGGLLGVLLETSQTSRGFIDVNRIVPLNSRLYMNISNDTLEALHIFATEHHPLMAAKGQGNAKEGFSLFALLDRTRSQSGRNRLREWMRKPLVDMEAIQERQDTIELFLQPFAKPFVDDIAENLKRVSAVDKILHRISKVSTKPTDLIDLGQALSAVLSIADVLERQLLWTLKGMNAKTTTMAPQYVRCTEKFIQQCNWPVVEMIANAITATIDAGSTAEYEVVIVNSGVDKELDELKQRYIGLHDLLPNIQDRLCMSFPHLRRYKPECFFLPQFGFLVSMGIESCENVDFLPGDFRFICVKESITLFKNKVTDQLDQSYGDIDATIKAKEIEIVRQLEETILAHESEIRETLNVISELDCIQALAVAAEENGYVRPQVLPKEASIVSIKKGRHPLQERVMDCEFIPNHTDITPDKRVNVITGPNFSGKSCYARQVGILVYMAHIGSFIPCDHAEISIFESIMAHFGSVESCSVPQSSFQYDLSCLASFQNRANQYSLTIIDEFGKGTTPSSGIALLGAALKNFSSRGTKVLCTTHFLELFSMNLLKDGHEGINALQMAIRLPEEDGDKEDIPVPTFHLERGICASSAGLACAALAGLDQNVISRARHIIQCSRNRVKLEPDPQVYRSIYGISRSSQSVLHEFLATDWKAASKDEIASFHQRLESLRELLQIIPP